jgi:hypothetical protein
MGILWGRKMPLISMVKEDIELSSTYGKPKLPRSFEERKRHGVKNNKLYCD